MPTDDSPDELVQVYIGEFTKAGYLKSVLESAGIEAFLYEEHMSTIHPIVGVARVMVPQRVLERATPIVQQFIEDSRQTAPASRVTGVEQTANWLLAIGAVVVVFVIAVMFTPRSRRPRTEPASIPTLDEAAVLYDEGEYQEAITEVQRVLRAWEQALGSADPSLEALEWLTTLLSLQGRYEEAIPIYVRLLELATKRSESESPKIIEPLFALAHVYERVGQYEKALPLYQRIIDMRIRSHGSDHVDVINAHESLGQLMVILGRYTEAKEHQRLVLASRSSALPADHHQVLDAIERLASLHGLLGDYTAAAALYERWLSSGERVFGAAHPAIAAVLTDYALVMRKAGKLEDAESLEARAKGIYAHSGRRAVQEPVNTSSASSR